VLDRGFLDVGYNGARIFGRQIDRLPSATAVNRDRWKPAHERAWTSDRTRLHYVSHLAVYHQPTPATSVTRGRELLVGSSRVPAARDNSRRRAASVHNADALSLLFRYALFAVPQVDAGIRRYRIHHADSPIGWRWFTRTGYSDEETRDGRMRVRGYSRKVMALARGWERHNRDDEVADSRRIVLRDTSTCRHRCHASPSCTVPGRWSSWRIPARWIRSERAWRTEAWTGIRTDST
jgi:hypothetical protein